MAQSHSRRKELDVPQWLNDACKSGNKTRIARQLQDAKFNQVTCWRPKKLTTQVPALLNGLIATRSHSGCWTAAHMVLQMMEGFE